MTAPMIQVKTSSISKAYGSTEIKWLYQNIAAHCLTLAIFVI